MSIEIKLTFFSYEEAAVALAKLAEGQRIFQSEVSAANGEQLGAPTPAAEKADTSGAEKAEPAKTRKPKKQVEAKPEAPAAKDLTIDDARNALQKLSEKVGLPAATEFVKAKGYARVSAIPAGEIAAFVSAVDERLAEAA